MRYVQKEKFYKSGNEPGSGSRNYGNTAARNGTPKCLFFLPETCFITTAAAYFILKWGKNTQFI